ncbi:hypothetical protein FS837_011384 [Tulasnella sp. UAMH 9824]|nr:hypothetical protein FS837_011384 [Tulasnella sp. UAMH 9824]
MTTKAIPEFNHASGEPLTTRSFILDNGAAVTQDFRPVKHICAHLNAFHAHLNEGEHATSNLRALALIASEDVRQCILYDSPEPNARLIGIEYMVTPRLYETLDPEERKLWHSHVYEVKSGMLIMPKPTAMPEALWQKAETAEMEEVINLYGKVYHLWQVDRGDKLPLGQPQLMTSFTGPGQFDFERVVSERDARFGSDYKQKQKEREYIQDPKVHPDDIADKTPSPADFPTRAPESSVF